METVFFYSFLFFFIPFIPFLRLFIIQESHFLDSTVRTEIVSSIYVRLRGRVILFMGMFSALRQGIPGFDRFLSTTGKDWCQPWSRHLCDRIEY